MENLDSLAVEMCEHTLVSMKAGTLYDPFCKYNKSPNNYTMMHYLYDGFGTLFQASGKRPFA